MKHSELKTQWHTESDIKNWVDGNGRWVNIQSMSDRWLNNIRKFFKGEGDKVKPILDEIKRRKNKRNKHI